MSGHPEVRAMEKKMRVALAEKMIVDFDYLPLPALFEGENPATSKQSGKGKRKTN